MPIKLYLIVILLAGAPGFGLETLLRWRGGRLNFENKREILKFALPLGLIIVGVSIAIVTVLNLETVYLFAITFFLALLLGEIISLKSNEKFEDKKPKPEKYEKENVKSMLKSRGLGTLIKDEGKESSEK